MFLDLKQILASHPILRKFDVDFSLLVYITATKCMVNAALVQEAGGVQHPVYFASRTLQDPETRY